MAYIPSKCSISDYEQVVYNGETKNKLYISFGGNELIDADHYCEKLTIKSRLLKNGNNYFSLDNFVSKEATLILHKIEIGKIKGPVIIELGTYIDKVQDYVYIPFGVFNIQGTPTNDKDKTTITLRDNSVNFDFDYNVKNEIDRNGGSATLYQILQDICKQAKVNCTVSSTLTGIDDKTGLYDNSIKARTYVSYIAEHCGKIATIDRNGYLIFVDLIGDAINLSGNNISIDNAIERPIETIQIDGKSTQTTRSGENLFNKNSTAKSNAATKEVLDTGVRAKLINSGNYRYFSIELGKSEFLGKTITLTRTITNSASNVGQIALYFGNETTQSKKIIFANKESGTSNIYIPNVFPEDCDRVWILFYGNVAGTGNVGDYVDYTNLMITVGNTLENYEDYGVSPSPDYPSEIECVKGKNLYGNITWQVQTYAYFQLPTLNEDYTLSLKLKEGKQIPAGLYVMFTEKGIYDTTQKRILLIDNGIQKFIYKNNTFDNVKLNYISVYPSEYKDTLQDYFDIQLEKGTVATDYLPYNTIQVKDVGKNLFDWTGVSNTNIATFENGVATLTWTTGFDCFLLNKSKQILSGLNATKTYTISFKHKGNAIYLKDYQTTGNQVITDVDNDYKLYSFDITGVESIRLDVLRKDTTGTAYIKELMITITGDTTFEPYQENTLNIDLQGNELCSLPNNVKDELVIENGKAKIIKRIGKVVLDGTESWSIGNGGITTTSIYKYFANNDDKTMNIAKNSSLLMCNYFEQKNIWSNDYIGIQYEGSTTIKSIRIRTNITSINDFKTWLSTHNTVVYYELSTPIEIDLGEVETLSTFKGVNNVSLVANMQTNMNLQYYKSKQTYTVPLNIVQSYEDGEDFKLSQVKYESGELYWNKGDNKNDTLYINSANPYITNQKNIDNIYNIVNGLEINSLKLKKQRGNPLLDCYDFIEIQTDNSNGLVKSGLFKSGIMKSMSTNATTYKTLAQNELIYNGKIMQTFDTTITKQAKNTNVSKNNEANLKKYVKSEIDGVKGELTTVVGKVDTIDVKTNNNYQEILNMFDEYTPQSDFLELENNVTRIQTDTYTKTEINQKLTNGSVTKVLTTAGTFDNNGLTIEKTNAKTKGNFNEKGMTIKDATGSTDTELLFAGYDDTLNETIVRTKNIKVEKYLTIGKNSRIEDYNNGTGVFHIGE